MHLPGNAGVGRLDDRLNCAVQAKAALRRQMMHQKKAQWFLSVKSSRTPYCRSALLCTMSGAQCNQDKNISLISSCMSSDELGRRSHSKRSTD